MDVGLHSGFCLTKTFRFNLKNKSWNWNRAENKQIPFRRKAAHLSCLSAGGGIGGFWIRSEMRAQPVWWWYRGDWAAEQAERERFLPAEQKSPFTTITRFPIPWFTLLRWKSADVGSHHRHLSNGADAGPYRISKTSEKINLFVFLQWEQGLVTPLTDSPIRDNEDHQT